MNYTVFRLITGKAEGTYSIKRSVGIKNGVLKDISYRPGTDSIFDEDNKKSASQPKEVVFNYNDIISDPAIEIVVPNANKVLIDFIKGHAKYNVDFTEYNADVVAQNKSKSYDDIAKALEFVNMSVDYEVKACALAVFGISHFQKSVEICKADLKAKAINEPSSIIGVFEEPDFQVKYVASLAFCTGIIVNNNTNTAILWADTLDPILTIAKGENGINKLTDFLKVVTKESEVLLQEFQLRLDKQTKKVYAEDNKSSELLKSKDEEIRLLTLKLKSLEVGKEDVTNTDLANDIEVVYTDLSLEELKLKYAEKFGTDLPARFKNDKAWIAEKLNK